MKMRGRIFGTLALTAAAVMAPVLVSTASAAYGPGACTANASVSPSTVAAGGSVTVSITGTCGNETFTVQLHSTTVTLGTITTNASGSGSGRFTIPSTTTSGTHTITVSDVSGNSGSATIVVTGGAAASTGLPITGTDAGLLGGLGAAAVGTGGLLVLAARKRRRNRFN